MEKISENNEEILKENNVKNDNVINNNIKSVANNSKEKTLLEKEEIIELKPKKKLKKEIKEEESEDEEVNYENESENEEDNEIEDDGFYFFYKIEF